MTRIEYDVDLRRMFCKNENMPRHKAKKYSFVNSVAKEGIPCLQSLDVLTKHGYFHEAWMFLRSMDIFTKLGSSYEAWIFSRSMDIFSLRSMKRREGVFLP
jgi:hypothetical protein